MSDDRTARDLARIDVNLPRFAEPRIPFHPVVQERFGVDRAGWRALIDAVWPAAKTADAVVLALSYCKARSLDPFKRPVHIVPVYSAELRRVVESVWPGIGELRTTAFRTGLYAGRDKTEFGPDRELKTPEGVVLYPEWAQVTVYRMCGSERRAYAGPQVYWIETYATASRDTIAPNAMWRKRPRGQLDKCAEAAALRAAFPEEAGGDYTDDEMAGQIVDHAPAIAEVAPSEPRRGNAGLRAAIARTPPPGEESRPAQPTEEKGAEDRTDTTSANGHPTEPAVESVDQETGEVRNPLALSDGGSTSTAEETTSSAGASDIGEAGTGRDPFWSQPRLCVEPVPGKERNGRPDWPATHKLLLHYIADCETVNEVERLRDDSMRTLQGLKLAYVSLYDEVINAIAARIAVLREAA